MQIQHFGVEIWMNAHEDHCTYNLAETCVESLTVQQLLDLSGDGDLLDRLLPLKLTYGAIQGSGGLRDNVAGLFDGQTRDNVIVSHGAIGANSLVYQALVSPGDHVIAVLPTYQQHYAIPESLGAEVEVLWLREKDGFLPDLDQLSAMVRPDTRLIAMNNPNNPTGALMDQTVLRQVAELADGPGAHVLCDEVYRGLALGTDEMTTSIVDVYERGISTGSMSKTFSLAGLRLGWVVGPEEVIHAVSIHRDYNTISVGMIDDVLATHALDNKAAILARSRRIVRENAEVLANWVGTQDRIEYVPPRGGTTALLKYDVDRPSADVAANLLEATGVLLTPGSALAMEGYLRIGYANNRDVLAAGLDRFGDHIASAW